MGSVLAFFFKAALGWACRLSASFALTCNTTGCESLFLAGRAGQGKLTLLGNEAEFILVPWDPIVGAF